ncbi:MAG: alanine racemase [Ignavibacteriales bacterium]
MNKWIEIHLDSIENNLVEIRRHLGEDAQLIAVIKADAYGMGAGEIAHTLSQNGVVYFAVAFLSEALDLRARGREEEILIFSPLSLAEARRAIEKNCILTVASLEDLEAAEKAAADRLGRLARIHVKVDTGLGRFGSSRLETIEILQRAADSSNVLLEGIYTHFSDAGGSSRYTMNQFAIFESILEEMEVLGINIPMRHCCSSSSFLKFPFMHLDAVRIGTLLGGQFPADAVDRSIHLQDPYRFKARVVAVRDLKKGSFIGYNRTYRLRRDAKVAVVAAGLADGLGVAPLPKPISVWDLIKVVAKTLAMFLNINRQVTLAMLDGQKAFIRGKVFMQFCQVEFPAGIIVRTGDEVELPVKRTLASRSISRVYYRDGQPGKIENYISRLSYTAGEE